MYAISDEDWPVFCELMRAFKSGQLRKRPQAMTTTSPLDIPAPMVCVLRDDLNDGGSVEAERLVYRDDVAGWDVQILGLSPFSGAFRLEINGELTPEISYTATADTFRAALETMPEVKRSLDSVTLGNAPDAVLMRWRVGLMPRLPTMELHESWEVGSSYARVLVTPSRWHGTGEVVQVHSGLPAGHPTPLRIGSQCVCVFVPGAGYVVTGAEVRKFVQQYWFTESEIE